MGENISEEKQITPLLGQAAMRNEVKLSIDERLLLDTYRRLINEDKVKIQIFARNLYVENRIE